MDIQPQQPISDDQELAKVLAGITASADGAAATTNLADDLKSESADENTKSEDNQTTDATTPGSDSSNTTPVTPPTPTFDTTSTATTPAVESSFSMTSSPAAPAGNSGLEAIKHDALNELRPLVDKLNLSSEEKFDTYLLIIRSTDDSSLVAPAFEAARAIADETERAQALFEIIKEIDYLSNPQKPVA